MFVVVNRHIGFLILVFIQSLPVLHGQDIFDAARKGDIKRMEELVKLNPDTINSRNANNFTPLIIAGYRNQLQATEFLLKHKVDVNAPSPEGPAILGVCFKGNVELAKLLLTYKADVNAQNSQGTSALMYAVLSNNNELVILLLKHGAKKELAEISGKTALDYAQGNNSETMIALLSDKK